MQLSPDKIYEKILDLRTPDEQRRTDAINYIPIIVNALGTARTSDELFPYIVESAIFTEDQWIQVLNALGKIDYTKFTNKQINNIFYTNYSICEIESRSMREAFVGCFFSIVQKLKEDIINGILKEFIQTMIDSDSPSIRATAISIYAQSISLFSTQIISQFANGNNEMISVGQKSLSANGLSFFLFGFYTVYSSLFLALGKGTKGFILGACRQGICFVPVIVLLPKFCGISGILYAQPIADVLSAIVTIFMALQLHRELIAAETQTCTDEQK